MQISRTINVKSLFMLFFMMGLLETSRILKLDEKKFEIFTKESEKAVVIMYEEWCGFSEKALHIFKGFSKNPKFTQLDIAVGLLDLHSLPEFKQKKGIDTVPVIEMYIKGLKTTY